MKPVETRFKVVVVDDDFMIARVHAKVIDSHPSYRVIGTAYNAQQTMEFIQQNKPDLLLLDVYLPDKSGLDILAEIRSKKIPCDVILITAAKEVDVVEEGLRLGIFDYLMKPFNLERLRESLHKYAQYKNKLVKQGSVDQEMIDRLMQFRAAGNIPVPSMESGIDQRTLERVKIALKNANGNCTADEVAESAGVSRSTARTYLAYLVKTNIAYEELSYGTVGRPRRLFGMQR